MRLMMIIRNNDDDDRADSICTREVSKLNRHNILTDSLDSIEMPND